MAGSLRRLEHHRTYTPLHCIVTQTLGLALIALMASACKDSDDERSPTPEPLLPFPVDDPSQWVCADSPGELDDEQLSAWCEAHPDRGRPADLGTAPATITDLEAKNRYDIALRDFLREDGPAKLGWIADQSWRLTGPVVGSLDSGDSYGVHPAVRVWYSPEVVEWMCAGRPDDGLPDGAMIVKAMRPIDAEALGIDPDADCMVITTPADALEATSWAVMVRAESVAADGWYWANPTARGDGNPPILTASAVTDPDFFGPTPVRPERNARWYPTGDLFGADGHLASMVTPYNQFGAYCVNCHASATSLLTFSSLDNVVGPGLQYRHFDAPPDAPTSGGLGTIHAAPFVRVRSAPLGSAPLGSAPLGSAPLGSAPLGSAEAEVWRFSRPREQPPAGFAAFYGDLGPTEFADAFAYRLPAETFDHQVSTAANPGGFVTSDQCVGCHDATVSNSSRPHMLIDDPETGNPINVSPYAEWRASPMGLAGRDPIFFAQLQSETNHLPDYAECIETTCLHCHGVMGQRQLARDTASPDAACKDLFAIEPPPEVPFGEPMRLSMVTQHQADEPDARYGNLARDGISCAVCHRISEAALDSAASHTGNWVEASQDTVFGPYDEVIVKPMENALGITPKHGEHVRDSNLCGTCHNILLPIFDNQGQPHRITAPDGSTVTASYEQSTNLEWVNSEFARGDTFRSCQDCHMPRHYKSLDLAGTRIANIESDRFAPTTFRLPDDEIVLQPREVYARHALHGINLFLNEMFQQFPLLLGLRQIDYMGATSTQPALITASESMQRMAQQETARISIRDVRIDAGSGEVEARVRVDNDAGHYLPSGVGFRRIFIELTASDADGDLLWASGRTNRLGVILDGTTDTPLATETGVDQTEFQPHYREITQGDQVQIYQELIMDSAGMLTTSFLRRVHPVKDNRLRPRGFDPQRFLDDASPFVQILGVLEGEAANDPHYYDPSLTGSHELTYRFTVPPEQAQSIEVSAVLYSQSIPPFYLQERFRDANVGPAHDSEIRRLYYLTSHLDTGREVPIADWKVELARASATP